jgi:hypothetical protein
MSLRSVCSFHFLHILALSLMVSLLSACGGSVQPEQLTSPPRQLKAAPASNVVRFPGKRKDYSILKTNTGFTVTNAQSTQSFSTATAFQFSDMSVNLLIGDTSKTITAAELKNIIELYVAFFNRVPDADGLIYWIGEIKRGMSIEEMSVSFYNAALVYPDLTGYTATMSNADFVRVIYKNVLGRTGDLAPPDEDVNYWAGEISNGNRTRGGIVSVMLNSAHTFEGDPTWGWVPQLLNNKVEVANLFAVRQGLNFNTPQDSISQGMLIAGAVTPSDTSTAKSLIGFADTNFDLSADATSTEFIAVQNIINSRCVSCHNAQISNGGIALHSATLIRNNAQAIYVATVITKAMPQDGALSAEQIAAISVWFSNGAK